jgi:hypothetical protein
MPTAVTERLGSPRLLAGTRGELRVSVSQDGEPVDIAAAPAPTVTLTNADTGAAITPAAPLAEESTGNLVQVLSAAETATPQRIRAVWSATVPATAGEAQTITTYHEIVGDVLFTLAQARAFDQGALANEVAYPQAAILAARDVIAEAFEHICKVSFGIRAARSVVDGTGAAELYLRRRELQEVSAADWRSGAAWTAFTAAELADVFPYPTGWLVRESGTWTAGRRNYRLDYTHGYARVPDEISFAALIVLRDRLPGTNLTNRALSQTNELGTFRIAAPGERGAWYGIPAVDEILSRYVSDVPGVA